MESRNLTFTQDERIFASIKWTNSSRLSECVIKRHRCYCTRYELEQVTGSATICGFANVCMGPGMCAQTLAWVCFNQWWLGSTRLKERVGTRVNRVPVCFCWRMKDAIYSTSVVWYGCAVVFLFSFVLVVLLCLFPLPRECLLPVLPGVISTVFLCPPVLPERK